MANFDEIEKIEITDQELGVLKRLFESEDFVVFKNVAEKSILKKTNALVTGTFREGFDETGYLKELRGFSRHWKRLLGLVKRHAEPKEI